MQNFLDKLVKTKREEVAALNRQLSGAPDHPLAQLLEGGREQQSRFSDALMTSGLSVIAEIKRRSPSKGEFSTIADPVTLAKKYRDGGAAAISVLTDKKGFGGSIDDLMQVTEAVGSGVPTLRKDFLIEPIQLAEAAHAGAAAALLIVAVLGDATESMVREAKRLGLEPMVEVFTADELQVALDADATIIAVNNRNLTTFVVDFAVAEALAKKIPGHCVTVAASGVHTIADAQRMYDAGYDAILVGESLVRAEDPEGLIQQFGAAS